MRKPSTNAALVRLPTAPPVLGDGLGEAVQSLQKRLLLSGCLCRRLAPLRGSALLGLAPFRCGYPPFLCGYPSFLGGAFFSVLAFLGFLPALFRYFLHKRSHHFHHLVIAVPFAQEKHDVRTSNDGYGDAAVDETMVKYRR